MAKVSKAIIINNKGEFLLQLRDNNPNIEFPLHWNLIGGVVEKSETPKKTIIREIAEELGIGIKNEKIKRFSIENFYGTEQYIFLLHLDIDINKIKLNEGLALKWFRDDEINNLKIGFNYKQILNKFKNFWKV